jgi:hypothetical protein
MEHCFLYSRHLYPSIREVKPDRGALPGCKRLFSFTQAYVLHSLECRRKPPYSKQSANLKIQRKPIMFRLAQDDISKLNAAAFRAGLSKTVYVQLALRARFKVDGVE